MCVRACVRSFRQKIHWTVCYITFHAIWDLKWTPEHSPPSSFILTPLRLQTLSFGFFFLLLLLIFLSLLLISHFNIKKSHYQSFWSLSYSFFVDFHASSTPCLFQSVKFTSFEWKGKNGTAFLCERNVNIYYVRFTLSQSVRIYLMCDIWTVFEEGQLNTPNTASWSAGLPAVSSWKSRWWWRWWFVMAWPVSQNRISKHIFSAHTHTQSEKSYLDEWQVIT